ncbi:hypothetical protein [Tenacibaculum sp. nBUS_03]|uniref:hypothetical protein n=1 Tax=Tenacibaculum sp. nBUS_03 TaxID=3395320 RepID=UPI003EB81B59
MVKKFFSCYLVNRLDVFLFFLLFGCVSFMYAQVPNAQLSGTNAYFRGNYIEAGLSDRGTFGAPNGTRPSGYHNSRFSSLGFIANPANDGWVNYDGDYFIPGTPEEGFAIEINGTTYNNNTRGPIEEIPGSITSVNSSTSYCAEDAAEVIWEGSVGGIDVHRSYIVTENGLFIKMTTTLTNTSSTTLNNIFWMHNVDPDNNQGLSGNFDTTNSIEAQASGLLDKLAVVRALKILLGSLPTPMVL